MRKIEDVRAGGEEKLNVVSRPIDTYVKPQTPEPDKLTLIAQSLTKYNPALQKYLGKKAEEKRNFEEAVGVDLYTKYKAPSAEIEQMIKNGEVEGLRRLTKHHRNGIHKMRHRALGDSINLHMFNWEKYATAKDANGNEVPLSQIDDEQIVMAAFENEYSRYAQEVTGGMYDKELFADIVDKRTEIARNTFVQRQTAARTNQVQSEKQEAIGQVWDANLANSLQDGAFVLEDTEGNNTSLQLASQLYGAIIESDMPEYEAKALLAEWFNKQFSNIDLDHIDRLKEVAQRLPYWDDPEFGRKIEEYSQQSRRERLRSDRDEKFAKEQAAEQEVNNAYDQIALKYNYDLRKASEEEWLALRKLARSAGLETLASLMRLEQQFRNNEASLMYGVDEHEFHSVWQRAARGQMSRAELNSLVGRLSPDQWRELESTRKAAEGDKKTGISGVDKSFSAAWKTLASSLELGLSEGADGEETANTIEVVGALELELYDKLSEAFRANPNLTVAGKREIERSIVGNMVREKKDLIPAAKLDPKVIKETDPKKAAAMGYGANARNSLRSFDTKNSAVRQAITEMEKAAKEGKVYKLPPKIAKEISATGLMGKTVDAKGISALFDTAASNMVQFYKNGG